MPNLTVGDHTIWRQHNNHWLPVPQQGAFLFLRLFPGTPQSWDLSLEGNTQNWRISNASQASWRTLLQTNLPRPAEPPSLKTNNSFNVLADILNHNPTTGAAPNIQPPPATVAIVAETAPKKVPACDRVIYVVDVGSPNGDLAWARVEDRLAAPASGAAGLEHLVDSIRADFVNGASIALGFEAPLFLPIRPQWRTLTNARVNEANAWSYGAGAYVATVGIVISAHVLQALASIRPGNYRLAWQPDDWPILSENNRLPVLFLWEAYVSGPAHARVANPGGPSLGMQDAATAALYFREWATAPIRVERQSRIHCGVDPTLSTIGAAALWSGWTSDVRILHEEILVLSPDQCLGQSVTNFVP